MADMNDWIRDRLAGQSPMGEYVMTPLGPKRRDVLAASYVADPVNERMIALRTSDPDIYALAMNPQRASALALYEAAKTAHEEVNA